MSAIGITVPAEFHPCNIKGILTDKPFLSIISNWYTMDNWLDLGNGLEMYPTLTPGHTQGVASAIFQITVGANQKGQKLNSEYNAGTDSWDITRTPYSEGDEIFFVYMGG